jgi:hypothetical protein
MVLVLEECKIQWKEKISNEPASFWRTFLETRANNFGISGDKDIILENSIGV